MKTRHPALTATLAALMAATLPVHAQTAADGFNPFAMLAPIMTPMGAMLVPMMAPMNNQTFNPATLFNPATMANPMAMLPQMPQQMPQMQQMPAFPQMQQMPGYGAPGGMVPFSGIQLSPQAYGMPSQAQVPFAVPQMQNPYLSGMQMPFAMPSLPAAGFPAFPGFPGFPMMPAAPR